MDINMVLNPSSDDAELGGQQSKGSMRAFPNTVPSPPPPPPPLLLPPLKVPTLHSMPTFAESTSALPATSSNTLDPDTLYPSFSSSYPALTTPPSALIPYFSIDSSGATKEAQEKRNRNANATKASRLRRKELQRERDLYQRRCEILLNIIRSYGIEVPTPYLV